MKLMISPASPELFQTLIDLLGIANCDPGIWPGPCYCEVENDLEYKALCCILEEVDPNLNIGLVSS